MTDPTTPEGRAELRELLANAEPQPWYVDINRRRQVITTSDGMSILTGYRSDIALVAAAVNALPALLDALDQADDHAKFLESVADINDTHAGLWQARATKAEAALDRVEALTYASDDGTECECAHPAGEGEPECPACWSAGIRHALNGDS